MGLWRFLSRRRPGKGVRLANPPDTVGHDHEVPKGHVECNVQLLDGTDMTVFVSKKAAAQDLIDQVAHTLDLVEKDYFGLQFSDIYQVQHWLDPTKTVKKQIKIGPPYSLRFRVKMFPPNPQNIREDLTKYLFFLQLKQDIQTGRLVCPSDAVVAELAAYILQSENGDYNPDVHTPEFVSEYRFVPEEKQTVELEEAILDRYKKEKGRTPAQVDYSYLQKVKTFEMYGVDKHTVMGKDGREYCLGLDPAGLWVMEGDAKIGEFSWDKTERVKVDGKKFTVIVKEDGDNGQEIEHTFAFWLPNKKAAKHLWKCAVEHHAFFQNAAPSREPTVRQNFFRMGSRFRHTGKTAVEIQTEARPPQKIQFERRPSQRFSRRSTIRRHPGATSAGAAESPTSRWSSKPVLPVGTAEVLSSNTISPPLPVKRLASIPQSPAAADTSCEVLATTFLSVSDTAPPLPPRLGAHERSPSLSEIADRDYRPPSSHTLVGSPVEVTRGRTPEKQPQSPTKPARTYQFDYQPAPPATTSVPFDQVKFTSLPLKTEEIRRSRGGLDAAATAVDEKSSTTLQQPPASGGGGGALTSGYQTTHTAYLDRLPPREINGFKLKTVESLAAKDQPPKELVSILKNTDTNHAAPAYKMSNGIRHPSSDSGRASPPSSPSGSPSPTSSAISAAFQSELRRFSFETCDTTPLIHGGGDASDDDQDEPQPTPLLPLPCDAAAFFPENLAHIVADCSLAASATLLDSIELREEPLITLAAEISQAGSNSVSRSGSGASAGSTGTTERSQTATTVINQGYQAVPWIRPDVVPITPVHSQTSMFSKPEPDHVFSFKQEPEKIRRVITTEL